MAKRNGTLSAPAVSEDGVITRPVLPNRQQAIELPPLDIRTCKIRLIGDSPLVMNKFSNKAIQMIADKQQGKAQTKKSPKVPLDEFANSLHWMSRRPDKITQEGIDSGKYGMPAICFKKAAVSACSFIDGVTKVETRGAFHVMGELIPIKSPPPRMREDMVRIAMGTSDIRYRGEFDPWECEIEVRYNAAVQTIDQIVQLFSIAGFHGGIGENRAQKTGGSWGMFHVANTDDLK